MAFSFTTIRGIMGNKKVVFGTWNAASVTSGDIVTGLNHVEACFITNRTGERAGQSADRTTTDGTISLAGVTSNDVGDYIAIGN